MSKGGSKVIVKVETDVEQQQHFAKCKKGVKLLQKDFDKENVTRSPFQPIDNFSSADIDSVLKRPDVLLKRKSIETHTAGTQTQAHLLSIEEEEKPKMKTITEKDLTSDESPGENYWEILAEKRRLALEDTLKENRNLHERIDLLEVELDTSKKMLDEAKNLVEVLTEMLEENEEESNNAGSTRINDGASTSVGDSCYFEASTSQLNTTDDDKNLNNSDSE